MVNFTPKPFYPRGWAELGTGLDFVEKRKISFSCLKPKPDLAVVKLVASHLMHSATPALDTVNGLQGIAV
jgi:hypothetical protein